MSTSLSPSRLTDPLPRQFRAGLFGAAAALLLVSACGSTGKPGSTGTPGATNPTSAATPGAALGVATTSLGPVLVDSKGMTVYLLTADKPGQSSCAAQCLQFWPSVPAPGGKVPAVSGLSAPLGVTKATNGASMLTAGGWPLYTFSGDRAPGDVTGQGMVNFGGTWYVVSPSGMAVKAPPPSASTSAPAPDDGGGGGIGGY